MPHDVRSTLRESDMRFTGGVAFNGMRRYRFVDDMYVNGVCVALNVYDMGYFVEQIKPQPGESSDDRCKRWLFNLRWRKVAQENSNGG